MLRRRQLVDGFVAIRISEYEPGLFPVVIVDALRAFQLKCWDGPLKSQGLVRLTITGCFFRTSVSAGTQHDIFSRRTRGCLIVLYSQHSCKEIKTEIIFFQNPKEIEFFILKYIVKKQMLHQIIISM